MLDFYDSVNGKITAQVLSEKEIRRKTRSLLLININTQTKWLMYINFISVFTMQMFAVMPLMR